MRRDRPSFAAARRAGLGEHALERFAPALPRDLHQPRPGPPDQAHVCSGLRRARCRAFRAPGSSSSRRSWWMKSIRISPPIFLRRSWRAASSAASWLVRQGGAFEAPASGEPSRVDVDGGQRFRPLDHQLPARGQSNAGEAARARFLPRRRPRRPRRRAPVPGGGRSRSFSFGMKRPQ